MWEFESVRTSVERRLEGSEGVESWLFEFHAVASGAPPEAQYLEYARNCDLLVLVIGAADSAATRAEYDEAFNDNPQKILPFFYGPESPAVEDFRRLIDARHTRVAVNDPQDLVQRIGDAVDEAVAIGTPIIESLRTNFDRRLRYLDQFIDLNVRQTLVPMVASPMTPAEAFPLHVAVERFRHLLISGPGGAGKTFGSLTQLWRWANDRKRPLLPLLLRGDAEETRSSVLIDRAFDAVRFSPGATLIERYGREGRLKLVFDGFDDLSDRKKKDYIDSVETLSERYPRSSMIFLCRRPTLDRLAGFERVTMSPLPDEAVLTFLGDQGYPELSYWDIPAEVRDLIGWPLWIQMFARFGTDVGSGLFLLQRLVDHRFRKWPVEETQREKARRAIGEIALEARPGASVARARALEAVSKWLMSPPIAALFSAEPAEVIVQDALATGLVEAEGRDVVFIHPLIGTVVAAEAGALRPQLPSAALEDPELAAFMIPLLAETRADDVVRLFRSNDILHLARALRLTRPEHRSADIDDDIVRFDRAFWTLSPLAGGRPRRSREGIRAIHGASWIALGRSLEPGLHRAEGHECVDLNGLFPLGYTYWEVNPFWTRTPEVIAAAEILANFKQTFVDLRPEGDPHGDWEAVDVAEVLRHPAALETRVSAFIAEFNLAKTDMAERLGLARSRGITLGHGEPEVTLFIRGSASRVRVEWGHRSRSFRLSEDDPDHIGFPLYQVVDAAPAAAAYEELKREVERELGSSLGSQSWRKPHLLAEWVW